MTDNVWVKTEPSVDGTTYTVTIEASPDVAVVLDHDRAARYAWGVLDAAHRADYDAAVLRQMRDKLGVDLRTIAQLVTDMRADRPPLDDAGTYPLRLEPGVAADGGHGFLRLSIGDDREPVGQWTTEDARQHALHVMESVKVADLDAGYRRALVGIVGVSDSTAQQAVGDLANFRERQP